MARAGIIYSHVAAAAAGLASEGKNPTVDTVRAALGATGSKSTIAPMLKRWKEEHAGTITDAASGLPTMLVQAVRQVYDGLRADATTELEHAELAHRDQIKAAHAELALSRAQAAALGGEKAALTEELVRAQTEAKALRAELHVHNVQLGNAQSENVGLTQRLADRAAEVATVNGQLTHARTQFEHYENSSAAQRSEERQSFERRVAQQEYELGHLRQQLELQLRVTAQHAGQMARVVEENERLHRDAQGVQQELGQLRSERERAVTKAAQSIARHTLMSSRQDALQREMSDTRTVMAVQGREVALAVERLAAAENRSDNLAAEKIELLQRLAAGEAELRLYRNAKATPAF
jgi:chromosome segregation ATPase